MSVRQHLPIGYMQQIGQIVSMLQRTELPSNRRCWDTVDNLIEVEAGGGGNCSVSDTINTFGGGGQVNFETLTINVDKCGGVTSYPCKTITINVDKCGGVTSYPCKTLTIIVDKCGGGWSRGLKNSTHDDVWNGTIYLDPQLIFTHFEVFLSH